MTVPVLTSAPHSHGLWFALWWRRCWRSVPALQAAGKDYDKCLDYVKGEFLGKNKAPEERQVYVHATCATDTTNISFVMESVFDIILKENLRKLAVGDVDSMLELASGTSVSGA